MQSTWGWSAASSSSRSAGSNRPACSTVSQSNSSAGNQTLRTDFDQPGAAVHQTRSPAWTPIHRSSCSRFAARYRRG